MVVYVVYGGGMRKWWYMAAVMTMVVYANDNDDDAAAAWQLVNRTWNSKEPDAKTSNLTRRCNHKFNKANTEKKAKAQIGSDMMN